MLLDYFETFLSSLNLVRILEWNTVDSSTLT